METTYSLEIIITKLKKFTPIKYNRFYWWRDYDIGEKPIHKRSSIEDKIKAGYYNFPESYYWQMQKTLLDISQTHLDDIEKISFLRSKHKRLLKDYYTDENEKLKRLREDFISGYNIKKEEVEEILENFNGTIEELYIYFETKYKYRIFPSRKSTINKLEQW